MMKHATRRAAASMVILVFLALAVTGCHDLNNIVDPEAAAYQGYFTVENLADVGPDNPADGETVYFQAFYASRVYGRDDLSPYRFTVSSSADSTYTSGFVFNNEAVTTNMVSTNLDLTVGTVYYWGAQVWDAGSSSWKGRDVFSSFIPGSIDGSRVSPENVESIDTTTPLIEWGAIEGATGYDFQISDSYSGVESAAVQSLSTTSYQVSANDGFTTGETIYWRVRPVKTDEDLGTVRGFWTDAFSFSTPIFDEDFEDTSTGSLPGGWYLPDDYYYYDEGWEVVSDISKEGDKCLASEDISSSEEAAVEVTVYCPKDCTLSFFKKVSSEPTYDELEFYIDGEKMDDWSGVISFWTRVSYDLDSGTHELKWVYSKDSSTSSGQDRAWIDKVVIE